MTDLIISGKILEQTQMSPEEFLIELAVYLYDKEILSMGKAKEVAKLDLISFQRELSKREVDIKYDYNDFLVDMKNLESMG